MAGVKGRSGGARPNSGPKKRDPEANWLSGHLKARPGTEARVLTEVVPCPEYLNDDAKLIWAELGPHAHAEGTLTERTRSAFAGLCRSVVYERLLASSGETVARTDHRGMMRQVEMLMARFRLIPDGKPVPVAEPKDEWQEFDSQPLKVVGGNG